MAIICKNSCFAVRKISWYAHHFNNHHRAWRKERNWKCVFTHRLQPHRSGWKLLTWRIAVGLVFKCSTLAFSENAQTQRLMRTTGSFLQLRSYSLTKLPHAAMRCKQLHYSGRLWLISIPTTDEDVVNTRTGWIDAIHDWEMRNC